MPVMRRRKRFRIDIFHDQYGWEAKVYDLADHGPNVMYAGVSAGSLAQVIDQASHYVLVAEEEPMFDRRDIDASIMPATEHCDYCRDTREDPEHHLTAEQKRALDAQQIGPAGCPACRPEVSTPGAIAYLTEHAR